jgi:tape measure domain-containing protein
MPIPRDVAVRFVVTQDDITKALKDQQEAAKKTMAQVKAIAGGYDQLSSKQRQGMRSWIDLTAGPREMIKAQQRMLQIQLQYNAAVAQARTIQDRTSRAAALVAAREGRAQQQLLAARELAEQRILDMERRRRSGMGGGSDADFLSMQKVVAAARAGQAAMERMAQANYRAMRQSAVDTEKNMSVQAALFRRLRTEQEAAAAAKKAADRQSMTDTEKNMSVQAATFRRLRTEQEAAAKKQLADMEKMRAELAAQAAARKAASDQQMRDVEKNMAVQAALFRRLRAEQEAAAAAARKADPFSQQNLIRTALAGEKQLADFRRASATEAERAAKKQLADMEKMRAELAAQAAARKAASDQQMHDVEKNMAAQAALFRRLRAEQEAAAKKNLLDTPRLNTFDSMFSGMRRFAQESRGLVGVLNDVSFKMFVITFAGRQMVETLLHSFVQVGEKVELTKFKLEGLTGSTETFQGAFNVAQELGVGLGTVTGALTRFAVVNKSVGMTNQELVQMTRNIAALGMIGGSGVQELQAGMIQLSQGFASNRLQGDEFRSVMENIPMVAVKMAEAFKVDIAGLRQMSTEGKITAQMMKDAFLSMTKEIDEMMRNIPQTSEMALARLSNSWDVFINEVLRASGMEAAGEAIGGLTGKVTEFGNWVRMNQGMTAQIVADLKDMAIAVGTVVLAFMGLRTIIGVIGTVGAAVTSVSKALTAYAFSMLSATTAASKGAAALTLLNAATKALFITLGPMIAVLGLATYAWFKFSDNQKQAREAAQQTRDALEELSTELENLTRNQLLGRQQQIAAATEDTIQQIGEAQKKLNELEQQKTPSIVYDSTTGEFTVQNATTDAMKALEQQMVTLRAQMDGYIQDLAREGEAHKRVNEALAERNKQGAAMVASSAATLKVIRDMRIDSEKLDEKLRQATSSLRLMTQFGVEEGERRAKMEQAGYEFTQRVKAIGEDPRTGFAGTERSDAAISARNDQIESARKELDTKLKLIDAEDKLNKLRSESRGASAKNAVEEVEHYKSVLGLTTTQADRLREILPLLEAASKQYGIQKELMIAVAKQESGFNMTATSPVGARGVMQFMPKTAAEKEGQLGLAPGSVTTNLNANIMAGAFYLRELIDKFNGDIERALGYYNGGGRGAGPNPRAETRGYKSSIMGMYQKLMMQGEGAGDYLKQEQEMARNSEDSLRESLRIRLGLNKDFYSQVSVLAMELYEANLQVDRDTTLSAQAANERKLANQQKYYADVKALADENASQKREYEMETAAITDEMLGRELQLRREAARQIGEVQREQAESTIITTEMMNARIDAILTKMNHDIIEDKQAKLKEAADEIGQAFGEAFGSLAKGGESARETLIRLLEALRDMVVRLLIIEPIAKSVAAAVNSIGSGSSGGGKAGGFLASIFGSVVTGAVTGGAFNGATAGSGALLGGGAAAGTSSFMFARGGLVPGTGLPHGVYAHPTFFRTDVPGHQAFARGTGVLGEAGPEAILPLKRVNGKLGVMADGGAQAPQLKVVVNNLPGQDARVSRGQDGGLTIDVVRQEIAADILRGGNTVSKALDTARARRG